jgi:hypothetical protein
MGGSGCNTRDVLENSLGELCANEGGGSALVQNAHGIHNEIDVLVVLGSQLCTV